MVLPRLQSRPSSICCRRFLRTEIWNPMSSETRYWRFATHLEPTAYPQLRSSMGVFFVRDYPPTRTLSSLRLSLVLVLEARRVNQTLAKRSAGFFLVRLWWFKTLNLSGGTNLRLSLVRLGSDAAIMCKPPREPSFGGTGNFFARRILHNDDEMLPFVHLWFCWVKCVPQSHSEEGGMCYHLSPV